MSETRDHIHVLFACDSGFLKVTQLAVASIAVHAAARQVVHAHIACDGVDVSAQRRFTNGLSQFKRVKIEMIDVDRHLLDRLKSAGRWSRAMYIRLFAAALLDPAIDRVIYLDGDAFAFANLEPLWTIDLHGRGLAACRDAVRPTLADRMANFGERLPEPWISKSPQQPHINSGVLVMDLDYWRRHDIADRAMRILSAHPHTISAPDQDLINILFDELVVLDPKWNIQMGSYGGMQLRGGGERYGIHVGCPIEQLLDEPGVIHFCGHRPWQGMSFAQFMRRPSSGYFYWQAVRTSGLYNGAERFAMLAYHLVNGVRMSAKDAHHRRKIVRLSQNPAR